MRGVNPGAYTPIYMGWKPGTLFSGYGGWYGYNEAMVLYLLALGSPTHPVPATTWMTWTSGYQWQTWYGYTYVNFPPLFGHQYSHCWFDFRNRPDAYMTAKGIDYFENSRRATLAAREYCIANPGGHTGYGANLWGLTASDDPWGYSAHGAPPAQTDNGTITPTAAASSIPFAPEVVIPTLHYMYDNLGAGLWGPYGFRDAFNLDQVWWDTDYLGIDEGPIIIMIENYRNQAVWNRFMMNPDVVTGLQQAGFANATGVGGEVASGSTPRRLQQNRPNPFRAASTISFRLENPGPAKLVLYDASGRQVRTLLDGFQEAGDHEIRLDGGNLAGGVYFYRLDYPGGRESRRCIVLR
jgi:hypothetical protein